LPEPEVGEGSETEELLVELKVEPKLEESGALPVVGTVDELRDEFCQQTSPEMRRNEARVPSPEEPPATPPTGKKGRAGGEARKGRGSVGAPALPPGGAAPPPSLAAPLTTTTLYYVGCRNDRQAISVEDKLTEVPSLQRGVEVPSWREDENHYALVVTNKISLKKSKDREAPTWRIKSTNPLYTTEAPEAIDDSTYLRRHDKHERDEKQRKRWDAQRMRQEAALQKLRARQEKRAAGQGTAAEAVPRASLLPALEAATAICVEEVVPVTVFGRPLPVLEPETFSLPWL